MSASSKKKLRNEQNAAAMTEKQLQEQKEAKKLRLYTGLFTAAIAVMIVVVIASRIFGTGMIPRSTTALTVDGSKISAAELNHYYVDAINGFLEEAGDYVSLFGLDTTKALDEQFHNEAEKITWADYFLESAENSAKAMYAVYNAAKADGYKLHDEDAQSIDAAVQNFELYAQLYGFSSADAYVGAVYGEGCNVDTFRDYAEVQMIASRYAADHNEALVYTNDDLRAAEAENYNQYSNFTYDYYYLAASRFYEGGTKTEDGNTTYSDEEMAAGRAAAEEAAKSLLTATNKEELEAAAKALEINAENTSVSLTHHENYSYANLPAALQEWVAGDRKAGEITMIANEYTNEDGSKTASGYYVVIFDSKEDNLQNLIDVRHVLISFEGGKTDETTGVTTYTDEEKAAAKAKAQEVLDAYLAGEQTAEAFGELAKEKSKDTGSAANGGLIENVYPGQMVTNFNDWCFDAARKTGDTGLVETEYGYHVMYFVKAQDTTYRDYMIENTLRNEDMSEWESGLVEAAKLEVLNTKYIKTDMVLSTASES